MTFETPGSFSNGGSIHQKHPPAKIARSKPDIELGLLFFPDVLNPLIEKNNTRASEVNIIKENK
jgi:hypothetical protein